MNIHRVNTAKMRAAGVYHFDSPFPQVLLRVAERPPPPVAERAINLTTPLFGDWHRRNSLAVNGLWRIQTAAQRFCGLAQDEHFFTDFDHFSAHPARFGPDRRACLAQTGHFGPFRHCTTRLESSQRRGRNGPAGRGRA